MVYTLYCPFHAKLNLGMVYYCFTRISLVGHKSSFFRVAVYWSAALFDDPPVTSYTKPCYQQLSTIDKLLTKDISCNDIKWHLLYLLTIGHCYIMLYPSLAINYPLWTMINPKWLASHRYYPSLSSNHELTICRVQSWTLMKEED